MEFVRGYKWAHMNETVFCSVRMPFLPCPDAGGIVYHNLTLPYMDLVVSV
jgi:hypothetical protein